MFEHVRLFLRAHKTRRHGDREEIDFLRRTVCRGQLALDIGANKGAYTYWLARAVGSSGRVVAFEPQRWLAQRLDRAVHGFGWDHVRVAPVALSSTTGTATFHIPADGAHWEASLERHDSRGPLVTESVETCRLDDLVPQLGLERVDFIKVDVEGHELAVFEGAAAMLQRDHPVLLMECEARHRPDGDVRPVFAFLESLGYQGGFLTAGNVQPLERFDPQRDQIEGRQPYINNFVFTC